MGNFRKKQMTVSFKPTNRWCVSTKCVNLSQRIVTLISSHGFVQSVWEDIVTGFRFALLVSQSHLGRLTASYIRVEIGQNAYQSNVNRLHVGDEIQTCWISQRIPSFSQLIVTRNPSGLQFIRIITLWHRRFTKMQNVAFSTSVSHESRGGTKWSEIYFTDLTTERCVQMHASVRKLYGKKVENIDEGIHSGHPRSLVHSSSG